MLFAAIAERRELVGVVGKRIDIPIISEEELGTSAGESTGLGVSMRRCCR